MFLASRDPRHIRQKERIASLTSPKQGTEQLMLNRPGQPALSEPSTGFAKNGHNGQ